MPIKIRKLALFIILAALMAILITSFAVAQTGGVFDLAWSTIDGGGGSSSGGSYALNGTSGQSDAAGLSGNGNFTLNSGFWQDEAVNNYVVFLPVVVR
jgi:hypothetical protein